MYKLRGLFVVAVLALAGCGSDAEGSGAGGSSAGSPDAGGSDAIEIRWSHDVAPGSALATAAEEFERLVESDPDLSERVAVTVYPSAQLYKSDQAVSALSKNDIQVTSLGNQYLAPQAPKANVFAVPFLFETIEDLATLLESDKASEIWEGTESAGLEVLGAFPTGTYGIVSNEPVREPADMNGVKVRAAGLDELIWQSLDAAPVNMGAADVYVALQQGTIQAASFSPTSVLDRKLYEVAEYFLDTSVYTTSVPVVVNKGWWEGLEPDIRERLAEHMDAAISEATRTTIEAQNAAPKTLIEEGMIVSNLDQQAREAWLSAVASATESIEAEVGENFVEEVRQLVNDN